MSKDFLAKIQAQRALTSNGQTGAAVAPTAPTVFDLMADITGHRPTSAQLALIDQVLTRGDDGALMYGDVKLSPVGLVIPPDGINQNTATGLLDFLFQLEGSIGWMIGDILSYGEKRAWGSFYDAAMQKYGRTYNTVAGYVYVASNVQFWVRTQKVPFSTHKLVAPMHEDGQRLWLEYIERNDWTRAAVKGYLALLRDASIDIQRQWLVEVEAHKYTPEQLADAIADAGGKPKKVKPAEKIKQQLTYAAYLSNVVKRHGVELDGAESDTIKHAVRAAREVMAMAQAVIDKHGGGK